jgi:hypothetical protein
LVRLCRACTSTFNKSSLRSKSRSRRTPPRRPPARLLPSSPSLNNLHARPISHR